MKRPLYQHLAKRRETVIRLPFWGFQPTIISRLSTALSLVSAQQSPRRKAHRGKFTGARVVLPGADRCPGIKSHTPALGPEVLVQVEVSMLSSSSSRDLN